LPRGPRVCSYATGPKFPLAISFSIPSHTALGLQSNLNVLTEAYKRDELVVSVEKTEFQAHINGPQSTQPSYFAVEGSTLLAEHTEDIYPGSILTSDCHLVSETVLGQACLRNLWTTFQTMSFLSKPDLTVHTQLAVYKAVCISTLIYDCES